MVYQSTSTYMWSTLVLSELFFVSLGVLVYFIRKTRKLTGLINRTGAESDEKKPDVLVSEEKEIKAITVMAEQPKEFKGESREAFSLIDSQLPQSDQCSSIEEISSCNTLMNDAIEELQQLNFMLSENIEFLESVHVRTPELKKTIDIIKNAFNNFKNRLEELKELGIRQKRELTLSLQEKTLDLEELKIEHMEANQSNEALLENMKSLQREINVLRVRLSQKDLALTDVAKLTAKMRKMREENFHLNQELVGLEKLRGLDVETSELKKKVAILENKLKESSLIISKLKANYTFLESEYKNLFKQMSH